MNPAKPSRGEVWLLNLDPTQGREQAGTRPALIVSVNAFNHGPAELVVVVPITPKAKGIPIHVLIQPPEGGLKQVSFVKCEDVRSVSASRLVQQWGRISAGTMKQVEERLRMLLGL